MKVQIFSNPLEIQKGLFSFIKPVEVEFHGGELDAGNAGAIANQLGLFNVKTFQSSGDDEGLVLLGQRYKPMIVAIPEGHPSFGTKIMMTRKLPKMEK